MREIRQGRCLCGAVTLDAGGPPRRVAHCHCGSCRKFTSAAFATFADFDVEKVTFTGKALKKFESSAGTWRYFCGRCGSAVAFSSEKWTEEISVHVGIFDEPEKLVPAAHDYIQDKLPWLHPGDGLKCHQRFQGGD